MIPAGPSPEICACGGKVAHVLIDGVTEIARLCRPCFEQYLKDRHAANKPIAVGWARELGLRLLVLERAGVGRTEPLKRFSFARASASSSAETSSG